jgi:hypothetical protein
MASGTAVHRNKIQKERQEKERKLTLQRRLDVRITNARLGKEAFKVGDFLGAIRKYSEYLETMAEYHKCASMYELHPQHFTKGKDLTEMLMMSHIYFELSKVYDATGKFQQECGKCLDQFVLFSANQPYQVVNSEMIRKHLRKYKFKNQDLYLKAYKQIFVQSRKCYIATMCFGDTHPVTEDLRRFKDHLLTRPLGAALVSCYYRLSSTLVEQLGPHPRVQKFVVTISRPILSWFSSTAVKRILRE